MKIYDKKLFWEYLLIFLSVFILFIILKIIFPDRYSSSRVIPIASVFIVCARGIMISLNEEKSKDYRLQQHYSKIAAQKLFGIYNQVVSRGWAILLILSVVVLKYSLMLSVLLLATSVIYILCYVGTVGKKAESLKVKFEKENK